MTPMRAALVAGVAVVMAEVASAQTTTRVSVDSSGAEASYGGWYPAISSDGTTVGFQSQSDDLVSGDTNGFQDVFVHDRTTGATERVSVDSSGKQANDHSAEARLSADGRIVAFTSRASNLVAGDTNANFDVFVHDRSTGLTERVSVDSSGGEAAGWSDFPSISADGRFVAFTSGATTLVANDTNGVDDIFVHDRSTGLTERVSVDSSGVEADARNFMAAISADGQIVTFDSLADDLVAGDANASRDIFVHDRTTGTTERVSVDSSGAEANDRSTTPAISADGRFVAFASIASNLVAIDGNAFWDVFVHDRTTGTTECVSVDSAGAIGVGDSGTFQPPSLSADGRMVAFDSRAQSLVPNADGSQDAYVRDRSRGVTDRLSEDSSGVAGHGMSGGPWLSADGQVAAFWSLAQNLVAGDTNLTADVFVRARSLAAWSNYGAGVPGTQGVPAFTARADPLLGTTVTLDLANSHAFPTVGLLFLGYERASIHSGSGGDLLVLPALVIPISFSYGFDTFSGAIPDDAGLCGLTIDLQAVEADPGAAKGVSFTAGLELVLGR